MKVREIMTRDVEGVRPEATLDAVAKKMKDLDVGAVPVMEDGKAKGIITDRDIVLRGIAEGRNPVETKAEDIMSSSLIYCEENVDIKEAAGKMEDHMIRRLMVVDNDNKVIGVLSLGDLAEAAKKSLAGEVIKEISTPSEPDR